MTRWNLVTFVVLVVGVLVLAVAGYLSLENLTSRTQQSRAEARDNLTWFASQAGTELLVLVDALNAFAAGDQSVPKDLLQERFDVFWSRVATIDQGPVGRRYMSFEGAGAVVSRAKQTLVSVEPAIAELRPGDLNQATEIRNQLRDLYLPFRAIALAAMLADNESSAEESRFTEKTNSTIELIFAGVLAGAALLVIVLLLEKKKVDAMRGLLEQRVEQRTRELRDENRERRRAESQLRQAQKLEAIGRLTGGIAHDFNNLLAVVMGNAEVLRTRLGDGDKSVQAVLRAATRGADLTGRLLGFSRQQSLEPEAVDLNRLVGEMTDVLRRTLGEAVTVETACTPELPPVMVDSGQFESALLNLAINARDAMPEGGHLVIETAAANPGQMRGAVSDEIAPGPYLVLRVRDTGHGMTDDVRERAFEPFFTTKDTATGTGLGLSLVYGFARQSGGHVTIDSAPGKGTTVALYLPATAGPVERDDEPADAAAARGRGEHILVVEDNADVRELAVSRLTGLGYRVSEAGDAAAGLSRLCDGAKVDLLMSDIGLPGDLNGAQLVERASELHPGLKYLLISGYPEQVLRQYRATIKESLLIRKPFRFDELASKLRATLDS